ncbi:MAG: hypothetical protein JW800_07010 [Candidatus Omnitrophica bacterium]|nr:hypothetical protein [Candidatus Omnitrophota bacterium]
MDLYINKRKFGFTLVEVCIAVAILILSTWALFRSLNFGYTLIHDIRELIVASSILQRQIEMERDKILDNVKARTFSPNAYYAGDTILYNATGSVIVEQYKAIPTTEVKKVTVSITWSPRLRPTKTLNKRISTIITKTGINYL